MFCAVSQSRGAFTQAAWCLLLPAPVGWKQARSGTFHPHPLLRACRVGDVNRAGEAEVSISTLHHTRGGPRGPQTSPHHVNCVDSPSFFQGRSPSDVSGIETAVSEDQPTPKPTSKARRVVVQKGPAAVHPAQRRGSVRPLKSQVEHRRSGSSGSSSGGGGGGGGGAVRRASSRSEPGRGWDVPVGVISEADVAGEGDDGDRDLWTWKEPPVQRKLGTVGGSGRGGGGAQSRGQGIAALSESKPAPSDQQLGRADSARSLSRAAKLEGARAPSTGQREQGSSSDPQADFWNPLGLMSEDSSQPKPTRALRRGTPLPAAGPPPPPPPPESTGSRGAKEGPSQHSVPSASSSRRGSGRGGLRRGVPYTGTAGASLGGESGRGAEEGSSQHSTARGPGDSE